MLLPAAEADRVSDRVTLGEALEQREVEPVLDSDVVGETEPVLQPLCETLLVTDRVAQGLDEPHDEAQAVKLGDALAQPVCVPLLLNVADKEGDGVVLTL